MLFTVCHDGALQRFRRRDAGSLLLSQHTTRDWYGFDLLPLILLLRAGGASFLDQCDLLFVRHAMDVPQVLTATLGSALREMCARRSRGRRC
jgi:hypothetical protein